MRSNGSASGWTPSATWTAAAERGRGDGEMFLRAYGATRAGGHEQAVEGSPIGAHPVTAVEGGGFEGTAGELLARPSASATEGLRQHEPRGRLAVPSHGMSLHPRPSQGRRAPPARAGRVSGWAGRRPRAVPEARGGEEMAAGSDSDRTG